MEATNFNCSIISFPPKLHLKLKHNDLHHLPTNPLSNLQKFQLFCFRTKPCSISSTHPVYSEIQSGQKTQTKDKNQPKISGETLYGNSTPIYGKNPYAIYKDVQKFASQNKLTEVFTILDYLDHQGVPVNVTTFSSIIAAIVRLRALDEGRLVHTHIKINGLEKNECLQTKLVHMYSVCGSMEDAKTVFDEMPVRSVYPWNALLRGNVVMGGRNYVEVLATFSEMRALGVDLNVYTFSCLIKSFAGASALFQGLKAHGLLIKNGLIGSNILRTTLMDMYFKCGKFKLALRAFEEVQDRDVVIWGAVIAGLSHNRLYREALEYLRWMIDEGVEVNSVIITSILPVIGEVRACKLGKEVHAYVIKTKEYSKQLFIQSSLVDMYCKCGDLGLGRKVFFYSNKRNAVTWTTLLSGYVSNGRLEQGLRSIAWMQEEGVRPDVVTVATVLPVCGQLKALNRGKEIHGFAVKNYFSSNNSVASSLMMMYSKCGVLEYSARIFDALENKNVILWTSMIDSYIASGCIQEAFGVFRAMQLSKHRPDSVAIARMLSVCGKGKILKLGREVHGQVLKKDLQSIPFVSAEIVKMYGSCKAIDKAKLAFELIPMKGSMTWTAIIDAYKCNDQHKKGIDVFKEMISRGFSPSYYTFKVVLSICEEAGFVDEAISFFTLLTKKYDLQATEEDYTTMIDLLSRSGRLKAAERYTRLRSSLVL